MEQESQTVSDLRCERAMKLIKEAVTMANVRDHSDYVGSPAYFARYWNVDHQVERTSSEWPQQRWDMCKVEYDRDVILMIQLNKQEGLAWIETSLFGTAYHLIKRAERVLDSPDASKIFKIKTTKDRDDAIDFNVCAALVSYINYVPVMLAKSLDGAFDDSIERQVRTSIKPLLRGYWRMIGVPEEFDVLSLFERDGFVSQIDEYRKSFLGKTPTTFPESLPQIYEQLRLKYRIARKYHKETRKLFLASNDEERWRLNWDTSCDQLFPDLDYSCLMMIYEGGHQQNSITASELAHHHLANWYGRSPEYVRKRISELRALANDKDNSAKQQK